MNCYLAPLNFGSKGNESLVCQLKLCFVSILLVLSGTPLLGQLKVKANRATAVYQVGETATFNVNSNTSGSATYEIRYDNYAPVVQSGTINITSGSNTTITFTGTQASAIQCIVKQSWQTARAPAIFGYDQIKELEAEPTDFDAFWNNQKALLAAIPMDAQVTLLYDRAHSTTYTISMSNINGRRAYGYISIPKGAGSFPAIITLPPFGATVNNVIPEDFLAENANVISLSLSIHNAPVGQTDPNAYRPDDITNREGIYYRYGVLAALRAIDYIHTRSDFNGQLGVMGVSQGGGLAIMAAGLDSRVKLLAISNPAMVQHAGLKYNRASGFPYYFNKARVTNLGEGTVLSAVKYYDAVYFAKRFNGTSLNVVSLLDEVCPPATSLAAYNNLGGHKILLTAKNLSHAHPEEYWTGRYDFLHQFFPATQNTPFGQRTTTGYFAEAGEDQQVAAGGTITLSGNAYFNGAANSSWPVKWEKVSGPGNVNFANLNNRVTNVSFSAPGTYKIRFVAEDAQSLSGQGKTYYISDEVKVTVGGAPDTTRPNVNLSNGNAAVDGPFSINISFSESVNGFDQNDFDLSNVVITGLSGSGANYTASFAPLNPGTLSISIPEQAATDNAGNGNIASNVLTINYIDSNPDTTPPQATLSTNSTEVTGSFLVNINFTESVTGLEIADFQIQNGSIASLNGSSNSYNIIITPNAEGLVRISLSANAVQDAAGNANPSSNVLEINFRNGEVDDLRPGVNISTIDLQVDAPFIVNIDFTEVVSGLSYDDFQLVNGTVSNLNGSDRNYSVLITPDAEGEVRVSLSANAASDPTGNGSFASNTLVIQYDDPNNINTNCVSSSNIARNGIPSQSSVIFGADAFRAVDGNQNGDFNANSVTATDYEDNPWWEVDLGGLSEIDEILVYNRTDNRSDRLQNFYILFSENPFGNRPLTELLNDSNIISFYQADQAGSPSQFTINTKARYVRIQLNYAEHLTLTEVEIIGCAIETTNEDNVRPGVDLYTNRTEVEGSFLVSVLFNEPVNEFTIEDIEVENGFASSLVGSQNDYRFFVTPMDEGEVKIHLPENRVYDAGGNGNWKSNILSVNYQTDMPDDNEGTYCTAGGQQPWQQWISNVKLSNLDYSSAKEGYGDFTDQTINLQAGSTSDIDLTAGYSFVSHNVFWRVWIDLNHNESFDDVGELVFSGRAINTLSGVLWIPPNVMGGKTRMRVVMQKDYYADACGTFQLGEVEDYTVNIFNTISVRESLLFTAAKAGRAVNLNWATNEGYRISNFEIEHSPDMGNFESIYKEDNNKFTNSLSSYSFTHQSPLNGNNYYRLKVFFTDGTYIFTRPEEVIFDIDLLSFAIYPNPTKENLFVNLRAFSGNKGELKVYDALGRVFVEKDFEVIPDHPFQLNLDHFDSGVYHIFMIINNKKILANKFVLDRFR